MDAYQKDDDQANDVRVLPMFPLGSVILPGDDVPLHVFEPRYREMVEHCLTTESHFGVVLIERGHEVGGGDVRGTAAVSTRIDRAIPTPDGRFVLECTGVERIRVLEWMRDDPYPQARITAWPDLDEPDEDVAEVYDLVQERTDTLFEILTDIAQSRDLPTPDVPRFSPAGERSVREVWEFASSLPLGSSDRAKVLAAETVGRRLQVLASALDDVIAIAEFSRLPDM
ncbi:MAG: LON peptidase substrate-binding domain-containing protein [Rhodococcus sp. (in: high G+C Gram-positive bacteria)]